MSETPDVNRQPPAAMDRGAALRFANTRLERPRETVELLEDPEHAGAWLRSEAGWESVVPLTEAELVRLRRLRDAVRSLLLARMNGGPPEPRALAVVNESAARAPRCDHLTVRWRRDVRVLAGSDRAGRLDALSAGFAVAAIDLLSDPATELAECAADDCVVIFERTDPRRRWHSERCGNRVRAARAYQRRTRRA